MYQNSNEVRSLVCITTAACEHSFEQVLTKCTRGMCIGLKVVLRVTFDSLCIMVYKKKGILNGSMNTKITCTAT